MVKFIREVVTAPYYRYNPMGAVCLAYAKWKFAKARCHDPVKFLQSKGFDPDVALDGFKRWEPQLNDVIDRVWSEPGGQGGVSPEDGIILYGLTRAIKPKYAAETGVAAGVSTSFIGASMIENGDGELYSIELPPPDSTGVQADGAEFDWANKSVGWAIPKEIRAGLGARHHLILEDVKQALPKLLGKLPYLDIFFHDDLHTPDHMYWEFNLVWPHLRSRGVLVADDVNFGWVRFCKEKNLAASSLDNVQRLSAVVKQ